MIRILHSVSNMDRGGVETMLMNFYRHVDREVVQFDFLANKPASGDYDEEIRSLGGNIYISPGFMSYRKYLAYMTDLFKNHPEYQIIHTHNGALMLYAQLAAKKNAVPVRIAHAHATAVPFGLKNEIKKLLRPMIKYVATEYWGCSDAAGKFYFSEKYWNRAHQLIHNAIDVENFTFNEAARASIREHWGFGDQYILGHVGRLTPQKNQAMLIRAFAAFHRTHGDYVLSIYGEGESSEELRALADSLGLHDAVQFLGHVRDVHSAIADAETFVLSSDLSNLQTSTFW